MTQQTPSVPVSAVKVVKGTVDEVETEAVSKALSTIVDEAAAAAAAAAANTTEARETARRAARTHARGMWGTPAESLRGVSGFNPTGFRG
ncbi:MAG TPA: hypothetical protein H9870_11150 [Candidatus Corynebacterium avicola]|uniref:Acyl-CoA carboxylase subunit epsilon n=1 Tax=Candidatus Corynebacterium avicola TaxID=2838527 RepID=A0A9D1ULC9_9CORY|nr:hypothetical protein [Candidatus Corynebacterium avicola]